MCGDRCYERSPDRVDARGAGHCQRKFHVKAGTVILNMPKLRKQTPRNGHRRAQPPGATSKSPTCGRVKTHQMRCQKWVDP